MVECYKMGVCIRSQHTTGSQCGFDQGSVLQKGHTTGSKVVAPGLLQKFHLFGVPHNDVFKKACNWIWQTNRMKHGTLTCGKEARSRVQSGGPRPA